MRFFIYPVRSKKQLHTLLILLLNLIACTAPHSWAQQTIKEIKHRRFHIQHFTDEEGLPQNSVKKIAADRHGYIWLGTDAGLTRFDGQHFNHYDEFASIRGIHSMEPAETEDPGFFYAITDQYDRIRIQDGFAKLINTDQATKKKNKLDSYLPYPDSLITRGLPEPYHDIIFPHHLIISFPPSQSIICSDSAISIVNKGTTISNYLPLGVNKWRYFRIGNTLCYLKNDGTLIRLDLSNPSAKGIEQNLSNISGAKQEDIHLFWSNSMDQAMIAKGLELYILEKEKTGTIAARKILSDFDINANKIISMYYDKLHKRLFLGSSTEGLFVITEKEFLTLEAAKGSNINHNVYYGQMLLNPQSVLTTQGEIFEWKNNSTILNSENLLLKKHFNGDKYSILRDSDGHIWTKNFDYLYKYNSQGTQMLGKQHFKEGMTWLYEGRNKTLWIGFRFAGLYQLNLKTGEMVPEKFIGPPLENISWMHQDRDDQLWVGNDKGLFQIDLKTKKVSKIKQLDGLFIRSIYSPAPNEMWITTYKNGFFLIQNGKIIKFPLDQKHYLARAHCLIEDSQGYMWITTNNGLFQIKKSALLRYASTKTMPYYRHFDKTNGFQINEFNGGCQPCGLIMPNGYISFPSMNGLVWFQPSQITNIKHSTPITIDNIFVDNNEVRLVHDSISINHDFNRLRLNISKAYFEPLNNLQLQYALTPRGSSTKQWYKIEDKDFKITISLLQPGEYQLTIRAVDGFEKSNEIERKITIMVGKPWYRTWWAYSLGLLLLGTTLYLALALRLKKALRRNEILEEKVRERTLTLRETILNMKSSQNQLINQNRLHSHIIASISHDVRSPLKFIYDWLETVPTSLQKNDSKTVSTSSIIVKKSVANMMRLTDDMTQYLKARTSGDQDGLSKTHLKALVDKKTELFKNLSWLNKGTISNEIEEDLQVFTNGNLLGIVIHNLLDNALKANPTGQVRILTDWKRMNGAEYLHLLVIDNGPGLPPRLTEWLNSPTGDNTIPPKDYQGLGLALIKNICDMLHITIRVTVRNGTKFELNFPNPDKQKHQIVSTDEKSYS
ncbi:sensor histidine kinase [Dyadobacter tibetensis]|uniref:sensor histidine kinase n=1 Tax=Dyadobacter tibetensis TaxID=1211851 RepID=UPI0004720149|nr:HAMP domain-containing sensor histidine kinase [Dyadobacter tibetensis]